ncbi:MAG: hypothetical protein AB7Q45_05065 [Planctomycetaceae bacterium]
MTHHPERSATSSSDDRRAAGGPSPQIVEECSQRLAQLAERVQTFLDSQCRRIEQACENVQQQASDHAAWEQMAHELRQQKALWEKSKQQQTERIAEELNFLAAAWDRIEAERRHLPTNDGVDPPAMPAPAAAPVPPIAEQPNPVNSANLFDLPVAASGRSAALQFQQIKREIRQHARRSPS